MTQETEKIKLNYLVGYKESSCFLFLVFFNQFQFFRSKQKCLIKFL